jgi:hypothetical protein
MGKNITRVAISVEIKNMWNVDAIKKHKIPSVDKWKAQRIKRSLTSQMRLKES